MTNKEEIQSAYRIRLTGAKSPEMWLSYMHVLRGGQRVDSPTWAAILRQPDAYTFHPEFLPEESAAYQMISRDIAEEVVRVLAKYGVVAEVV